MIKFFNKKAFLKVWSVAKSWVIMIVIMIFLQQTGLLSSISIFANQALMATGVMDASTENTPSKAKDFDYQFTIKTLDGVSVPFGDFKDKVVFLNLWATWCGPCRAEMPSIQALYDKIDKEKIVFIMLSLDRPDHLPQVKNFISTKEHTFPVYLPDGYLPEQLQVRSIPTTFIIDRNGKLVSQNSGTSNYDTPKFKSYLENLAKGN